MSSGTTLVRTLRGTRTQRDFAYVTGALQPSIAAIESGARDPRWSTTARLAERVGASIVAIPTIEPPLYELAERVTTALQQDRERWAFRAFLDAHDSLRRCDDGILVALTLSAPAPTGDSRYDAALAALTEHHLTLRGLPVPRWVEEPSRFLSATWFVDDSDYARQNDAARSPRSFARRGIALAPTELESV